MTELRLIGHISVAYIDDICLISDSYHDFINNVCSTTMLLDSLGFTIHPIKSSLKPSQCIEFLGFKINSLSMSIELTKEKRISIKNDCIKLLKTRVITIREFAQLIGKMVASEQGIPHAPLFYRRLEMFKSVMLKCHRGNFDSCIKLNDDCRVDNSWWNSD